MATQRQGGHPGYQQEHFSRVEAHAAATTSEKKAGYVAQRACRVRKVAFTPDAAVTGTDTNSTNLNVLHGSTEKSSLELVSGTDLVANAEQVLYEPTTPLSLAAGEIIHLQEEKVGTGLDIPSGLLMVEIDFEP